MIQLKRLTTSTSIDNVQLEVGQPLVDPNNSLLYIGKDSGKLKFYDSDHVDKKLVNKIKVGESEIEPASGELEFKAGTNITLGADNNTKTITISSTNTAHTHSTGEGLFVDGSGGVDGEVSYSLNVATQESLGGIKLGFNAQSGMLPIKLGEGGNNDKKAYASLPTASTSSLGGVKSRTTGTASDRDYYVEVNSSDSTMKVNVPWSNTAHTHTNGVGLVKTGGGGVEGTVGYKVALTEKAETPDKNVAVPRPAANADRTYPVIVDKENNLATIVPWINSTVTSNAPTGAPPGTSTGISVTSTPKGNNQSFNLTLDKTVAHLNSLPGVNGDFLLTLNRSNNGESTAYTYSCIASPLNNLESRVNNALQSGVYAAVASGGLTQAVPSTGTNKLTLTITPQQALILHQYSPGYADGAISITKPSGWLGNDLPDSFTDDLFIIGQGLGTMTGSYLFDICGLHKNYHIYGSYYDKLTVTLTNADRWYYKIVNLTGFNKLTLTLDKDGSGHSYFVSGGTYSLDFYSDGCMAWCFTNKRTPQFINNCNLTLPDGWKPRNSSTGLISYDGSGIVNHAEPITINTDGIIETFGSNGWQVNSVSLIYQLA